jgi:hypothetical protein
MYESSTTMSDFITCELNAEQRNMLLRGIQWMRSKAKLTPQDPTDGVLQTRADELVKLDGLAQILNGEEVVQETSV